MTDYKIEQDSDGQLWYRGWRLEIIPCGSQFQHLPFGTCHCGQPMYVAYPPYEGTVENLLQLWQGTMHDMAKNIKPEYRDYAAGRHVRPSFNPYPTIQDVIDHFESLVEQVRKKTWEEVVNAQQNS